MLLPDTSQAARRRVFSIPERGSGSTCTCFCPRYASSRATTPRHASAGTSTTAEEISGVIELEGSVAIVVVVVVAAVTRIHSLSLLLFPLLDHPIRGHAGDESDSCVC